LGLATSYGIIEGHGGKIGVKSRLSEGTTFRIELPAYSETQPILERHPINEAR
jgi:two-component system NtrC family sensor kinase